MKKVIFVVNTDSYSGAEAVNIKIIENLKDKYDFYYACPSGKINEYLEERNIKHINIKKVSMREIKRIVKEYKPDVLHATDFTASCVCASCKKRGVKVISHIHCNPLWLKKKINFKSILYFLCAKKFDKILVVSNAVIEEYVYGKYIKKKVENVSNPVSVKVVQDKVADYTKCYDICYCGRLSNEKNPLGFIDIIGLLKKDIPTIKAIIVGSGNLEKKCVEKINELKLQDNVEMVGFQKNPYEYIAKSKMLLSTSVYEGYGLVAFEALALGVPVAAPNVGGVSKIVTDKCGIVYNNEKEVVDYIKRNINKYMKFGNSATTRAKELDNLEKYMTFLDNLYA